MEKKKKEKKMVFKSCFNNANVINSTLKYYIIFIKSTHDKLPRDHTIIPIFFASIKYLF